MNPEERHFVVASNTRPTTLIGTVGHKWIANEATQGFAASVGRCWSAAARPLQRIRSRRSHHRRSAAPAPRDPAHSSPCPIGLVLDQPEPKPPPPQTAGVPILANVGLPTTGRPPRDFSNCCLKIFCVIPQKMTRVSRIAKPNPITSDVAMLRQFRFPIPSSRVSFNPKYEGREIGVQSNRFRAKRRSRNCLSI
jgi:hypothetical protein